uniref:C-type natriuretic peptide n=1 Tax=Lethenteron camtschaticum TaxID=980415 RepID=Q402A3_LETCA|nr:C-type natriuretic peptide [Lethenteron camtschaticum]
MKLQLLMMVVVVGSWTFLGVGAKPLTSYELYDDAGSEPWEGGFLPRISSSSSSSAERLADATVTRHGGGGGGGGDDGTSWELPQGPPGPPRSSRGLAEGGSQVSGGVWQRLFNDFVSNQRRFRGRTKKGKGCFGVKLDRIGSMSGLGC